MTRPASQSQAEQTVGLFGYVVLKAVQALGDDAYGLQIARTLYDLTDSVIIPGRVYLTLKRLESRGFLTARKERREGGSCKTVIIFTVTATGKTQMVMADTLVSAVAQLKEVALEKGASSRAATANSDCRNSGKRSGSQM